MATITLTQKDAARFWSKVDKRDSSDCWDWKASVFRDGYGLFHLIVARGRKRNARANRIAYALEFGDPGDFMVCHRCDRPLCCNPSHLFLGTATENNRDREAKGRGNGKPPRHLGEKNHKSKLTAAAVAQIRSRRALGERRDALSVAFGVSIATIYRVTSRKNWSHVDAQPAPISN